jgi:hypothetical protein
MDLIALVGTDDFPSIVEPMMRAFLDLQKIKDARASERRRSSRARTQRWCARVAQAT